MARVTAKGQITIPIKVRKALDIEVGDDVLFDLALEGARLRVRKRSRLSDLYGSLPATRAYPGKERLREETGRALGEAMREPSAPK